ncbi:MULTISPECIES: hypothetical protein [unclassified Legionella]|uniref:hypothetical protein n=1 Tax=unclassified Legionella TaxID=2622702 RepID=UPI001054FA07|nr:MULTISPECIES: hypothetical protein [unclassified Legionella]MDI9819775.1 hypothetical protein [Legionella sp. PL877]
MNDEAHTESTFLEAVDKDLQGNILRLEQKLKGLQAEISAKLHAISLDAESSQEQKERLLTLANEVDRAVNSLQTLVNMVIADDLSNEEFLQINHDSLEDLREMFKDSADKISNLKEKL